MNGEELARSFFARVWGGDHDLSVIDQLMSVDYRIDSAGLVVQGRDNFKKWVAEFQNKITEAENEHLELFSNMSGDRVVSRWVTRGKNNGMFGLPADGRLIAFTGIAIWRVAEGRLAECWVERSAFELYAALSSPVAD